jgi:outer membrane immunogenic protein
MSPLLAQSGHSPPRRHRATQAGNLRNVPFVGLCRIAGLPTGSYVALWGIPMSNRLISVALTTFILAASGSAFAADMAVKMPVKAPPPPPAPVYNWTGFYVGGNVGYGWGSASSDVNYFQPFAPDIFALRINGSDTVHMNGVIGGVQAGYNLQSGNYLFGIETDFQGSGQSGTSNFNIAFNNGNPSNASISLKERMPWFGTVRGRVGYVANQWLLYATGGLAYGRIEGNSSATAPGFFDGIPGSGPCPGLPFGGLCPVWSSSGGDVTRVGWTVGGGAELALGGNWTAKFEYLFVDLGSFDTTFTGLPGCFGGPVLGFAECNPYTAAGTGTIHSTITDNIVRVGLNYQFH